MAGKGSDDRYESRSAGDDDRAATARTSHALSAELIDKLCTTFENAADDDVRAIVLTGAGTVFCAGIDLSGPVSAESLAEELQSKALALNMAIDRTPVPVIAAINGPAICRSNAT